MSGAGPIFHRVFELLHRDTPATFPEMPDSLRRVEIDRRTGSLATPATPPTCRRSELATAADLQRLPRGNFDADGRAILDSRYAEWYGTSPLKHLYALADAQADTRPPAILIPANGSTLTLEPTLPHSGALVELKSTLPPATTTWHSPTLRVERRNGKWYAHLKPGIHTLYATAPPHSAAESTFRVQVNAK